MNHAILGRITSLNPRDVWTHEATQFTPWLLENIELLSEALGVEIEILGREVPVGGFAVDLFGREAGSGLHVIIENQLEATDYGHLGQLLTYAAGLDAGIVIWVSPKFRDEHKKAIDWLNRHTTDELSFFGVQIELLRIGDSLPAPLFSVEAQPNEWKPSAVNVPTVSSRQQAYHEFFVDLLARLKQAAPGFTRTTRVGFDNWLGFSAGRSGFGYSVSFSSGERFRTELYIDLGEQRLNKLVFDELESQKQSLAADLGFDLQWQRLDHRRASRICIERGGSVLSSPETLDSLKDWGIKNLIAFRRVITPRLQTLNIPAEVPEAVVDSDLL